jgi:hypothetical protein
MEAQSKPDTGQSVTFASYVTRRRGLTSKPQRRFFAHRRALLYAEIGDSISEITKVLCERIIRTEWLLILIDRRIDAGEKLAPEELRTRANMDARLRADLSRLMPKRPAAPAPKPKPKPKRAAPKKAPAPKPVVVESDVRSPSLADAVLAGKAPPP